MNSPQPYNPKIIKIIPIIKMSLDFPSLKKIIGDSTEVMVYGFSFCGYETIEHEINHTGTINAFNYEYPNYQVLEYKTGNTGFTDSLKAQCKATITSLLIENYKRSKQGQPLIPVLFCVELSNHGTVQLDIDKIVHSDAVTHTELRRCYKCLYDMDDPEIKKIVVQTFKFVRVTKSIKNHDTHFHLQEISPFWTHANWPTLWNEYSKNKKPSTLKPHPWRAVLVEKIAEIDAKIAAEPDNKRSKLSSP